LLFFATNAGVFTLPIAAGGGPVLSGYSNQTTTQILSFSTPLAAGDDVTLSYVLVRDRKQEE
jgi:hypothetical protein